MTTTDDIAFLEEFRETITKYLFLGYAPLERNPWGNNEALAKMRQAMEQDSFRELRRKINMSKGRATQILSDLAVGTIMVQYPAPAVGGPVLRFSIFDLVTENSTHHSVKLETFTDKIDEAIGILMATPEETQPNSSPKSRPLFEVTRGFVFIAMAMDGGDPQLEDVHDAVKTAADSLSLAAERVDDPQSNERITDRILESLQQAEFVVADLTHARPNVYWEAGYAHALGKTPIYIARDGTKLEFDVKDYPVIFFRNIRELKDKLHDRLSALLAQRQRKQ